MPFNANNSIIGGTITLINFSSEEEILNRLVLTYMGGQNHDTPRTSVMTKTDTGTFVFYDASRNPMFTFTLRRNLLTCTAQNFDNIPECIFKVVSVEQAELAAEMYDE